MKRKFAYITSSVFGIGYTPFAPGTVGSLFALIVFYFLDLPVIHWIFIIVVIFFLGVWVSTIVERDGEVDPSLIVIDELAGQWTALIMLPAGIFYIAGAFALFRIFDIWKPFPIDRAQNLKGGWGVMLDDILAGIYANFLLQILNYSGLI